MPLAVPHTTSPALARPRPSAVGSCGFSPLRQSFISEETPAHLCQGHCRAPPQAPLSAPRVMSRPWVCARQPFLHCVVTHPRSAGSPPCGRHLCDCSPRAVRGGMGCRAWVCSARVGAHHGQTGACWLPSDEGGRTQRKQLAPCPLMSDPLLPLPTLPGSGFEAFRSRTGGQATDPQGLQLLHCSSPLLKNRILSIPQSWPEILHIVFSPKSPAAESLCAGGGRWAGARGSESSPPLAWPSSAASARWAGRVWKGPWFSSSVLAAMPGLASVWEARGRLHPSPRVPPPALAPLLSRPLCTFSVPTMACSPSHLRALPCSPLCPVTLGFSLCQDGPNWGSEQLSVAHSGC